MMVVIYDVLYRFEVRYSMRNEAPDENNERDHDAEIENLLYTPTHLDQDSSLLFRESREICCSVTLPVSWGVEEQVLGEVIVS